MEYFIRGKQVMVTWLAERHRRTLCLMQSARHCSVRAYLPQGVRPHVNLYGVRYTNDVLATSNHAWTPPVCQALIGDGLKA